MFKGLKRNKDGLNTKEEPMEVFELNENHRLVICLIMLCKMTKNNDPIAYTQYKAHLRELEEVMMREFDNEDVGNNCSH